MKIYKNPHYTVIEDLTELDITRIRQYYKELLIRLDSIQPEDNINRCYVSGNYTVISSYGPLQNHYLYSFVTSLLDLYDLKYVESGYIEMDDYTPWRANHDTFLGGPPDAINTLTHIIESGVKPLCDVLNDRTGVTTYSSCEGHGFLDDDTCKMFVHFRVFELATLESLLKMIYSEWTDIIYDPSIIRFSSECLITSFKKLSFALNVFYKFKDQQEIFNLVQQCYKQYRANI